MAKLFSFASWNVENFHGKPARVDRIVDLLTQADPDVFGIYEVRGKSVFQQLMTKMPNHSFTLTENTSQLDMEILIGVRRTIPSFVTQREEFRAKVPTLRPGALATLRLNNQDYALLFLHVKSFQDPRSWGLRDDMFKRAASLKRVLDKNVPGGKANFICLGDLNTMGLNAAFNPKSDLNADEEIEVLEKRANSVKMRLLPKTHEVTWWNGGTNLEPSKLDHVLASNHLTFKQFSGKDIHVIGWPEESTKAKQRAWINKFSDHALVFGEVHS